MFCIFLIIVFKDIKPSIKPKKNPFKVNLSYRLLFVLETFEQNDSFFVV